MRVARSRFAVALAAIVLMMVSGPAGQGPQLPPLRGVDELKSWFNANRAHARLLLLLSPT
jgi:hypothetical protein